MKTLLMIMQMIPSLIAVIKGVEELIPESGKGEDKLSLVQKIMTLANTEVQGNWSLIEKIIAAIVETANKVGVFKK